MVFKCQTLKVLRRATRLPHLMESTYTGFTAHDILLQGNAIQCERDEVLLEEF